MRHSSLLALALAALAFAATQAQAQESGVLRLPWNQWTLHRGDDPQCAQIDAPACTGLPFKFEDWNYANQWQRIEVTLPTDLRSTPQLGLLVQGEQPVYEVFVNGQRIGGSEKFATLRVPQYSRAFFSFPSSLARQGRLVIAIHAQSIHTSNHVNGFVPAIAPFDRIRAVSDQDTLNYLASSWLHYLCYAAMFGAGIVFLLLFGVNTRAHEYFWLGARLCALFIFRLGELASVINLSVPAWLALLTNALFNGISPAFSIEFVFSFLGRPVPRLFRAIQILCLLNAIPLTLLLPLSSSLWFPVARLADSVYVHHPGIAGILLSALAFLMLLRVCLKSKLPEMRWIGAAALFFAIEESNRMAGFIHLPSLRQDYLWGGVDIDLRAISNLLFAVVMLIAMTFRFRRIQDRNRDIEQEMAAARSIQQILIPDHLPSVPGLLIESAYLPAQEVGGDFFQILPIPNSAGASAFFILGDVSGKGLKAAMTVSMIVGTLRTCARHCSGPAELLDEVNRSMVGRSDGFATCLALMIEPSGKIKVANAGHPNPYVNGIEIQTEANLPLGLVSDIHYAEITLHLDESQLCTLVTDGVVEATSATTRELFGFDRTQSISTQPANSIAEAARMFGLGAPQADDITVLTIARTLQPQPVLV
jgi:sigma-B regulation protein RsbU (phosphoserine phosphatase)